jgi:hypothetical protein
VYVIALVPPETPVTTPELFTVATLGVADTQGLVTFGVAEPVNVLEKPTQTFGVPVIVGKGFTVIVRVTVQPLLLVYVIILVPAETPVTTPELLTVATLGVADTQGFVAFGVAEPVKLVVKPTQTVGLPVIVGKGFTVIVCVILHPLLLV